MEKTEENLTSLENLGYVVLADFLRVAPDSHRYVELYEQSDEIDAFLDQMSEKGDFGEGLFNDHLGNAAKHADGGNAPIILDIVNRTTRYAIISPKFHSKGYGERTVPKEWVQRVQ